MSFVVFGVFSHRLQQIDSGMTSPTVNAVGWPPSDLRPCIYTRILSVQFTWDARKSTARRNAALSQPGEATDESAKPMTKRSTKKPSRGQAKLAILRRVSDAEIARTSPPELAELPPDFWADATRVSPVPKKAISLRVDEDVLEWFRTSGPRYQTRMNAVLRSYVAAMRQRPHKSRASIHRELPPIR